jgi:phage-related protein
MRHCEFQDVLDYIRAQELQERIALLDWFKLLEKQTQSFWSKDGTLVSVKGYKNLYELRFRGRRGHHRFLGPILDDMMYVLHSFLKQGKRQEQKEYKIAAQKSKMLNQTISKK